MRLTRPDHWYLVQLATFSTFSRWTVDELMDQSNETFYQKTECNGKNKQAHSNNECDGYTVHNLIQ